MIILNSSLTRAISAFHELATISCISMQLKNHNHNHETKERRKQYDKSLWKASL